MKIEFYCQYCGATFTKEIMVDVYTDIWCSRCERDHTTIKVLKEEVEGNG